MKNLLLILFVFIALSSFGQKAQVVEGQIVRTGIPSKFTRPNGQTVWGGYQNMPDSVHYADGFRDVVRPAYDPYLQQLVNEHYDVVNDVVTYDVTDRQLPSLDEIKAQRKQELFDTMMEFSGYITACNNLYGDSIPPDLANLITTIRGLKSVSSSEIDTLSTPQIAVKYVIRGPQVEALLDSLKSYLQ